MTVDSRIVLTTVQSELHACEEDCKRYGWEISKIDEEKQTFIVKMKSPIDNEQYIIEIKFDNYNEWPPYIEFIDPTTDQNGTKNSYPLSKGDHNSFFNTQHPCICHPCSRKAYKEYTGLHKDDWKMIGWQNNQSVGTLTDIRSILLAIYHRISNTMVYAGRMK